MLNLHYIYSYDVSIVNSLIEDIKANKQYFIIPVWDQHCINTFYNKRGWINGARLFVYKQRNDIEIQYLSIRFKDSDTVKESLYRIKNQIYEKPKCPTCGQIINFAESEFPKHCSYKCSANDPHTRELCKETCKQNWGVENTFQSKEIQRRWQENSLKKYGTKSPGQRKEIQEKRKQTNLKKYGYEYLS